jgi:hypothetical protein
MHRWKITSIANDVFGPCLQLPPPASQTPEGVVASGNIDGRKAAGAAPANVRRAVSSYVRGVLPMLKKKILVAAGILVGANTA